MKRFLYIKWWLFGVIVITSLAIGFAAGAMMKLENVYDAGYNLGHKIAIEEIRLGTKTAYRDKQQFFWLPNIPYRFTAISEKIVVIVFKNPAEDDFIAGAGDEGVRKIWK